MRSERTTPRAVLNPSNTAQTELGRGDDAVGAIAGSAKNASTSGLVISSGSRPMPTRAARPPNKGQAATIGTGGGRAGPAARNNAQGIAAGCTAANKPSAL